MRNWILLFFPPAGVAILPSAVVVGMTRLDVKDDSSTEKLSPTLRQNRAKGWGNPS